jgi:hypothetical protein
VSSFIRDPEVCEIICPFLDGDVRETAVYAHVHEDIASGRGLSEV